jgi:putative flippase GtrA
MVMTRKTFWQLVRYGVNGVIVTAVNSVVYLALAHFSGVRPQLANLAGYLVAVGLGYLLHSQVTFRDHGARDQGTRLRFAAASLFSYVLNAFWTYLCTDALDWPNWSAVVPMSVLTPMLMFAINRWWVFR